MAATDPFTAHQAAKAAARRLARALPGRSHRIADESRAAAAARRAAELELARDAFRARVLLEVRR